MDRVIVTGATSMIGVALVETCIRENVHVVALVRSNSPHINRLPKSDRIDVVECELDNMTSLVLPDGNYDAFYHFAWTNTSKTTRDDPALQEKNICYTLYAVQLAKQVGCTKFIFAGSQAEYGVVKERIAPTTAIHPQIAYGMAKYAAGALSSKLCEQLGICHIWARIFSVYGRYDNENTMLSYAIDSFLKGEVAHFSPATQKWDYLNEYDAGMIFYLLGKNIQKSKIYCVANGQSKALRDFIEEVRCCFPYETKCTYEGVTMGKDMLVSLDADVSELLSDINYKPQISFQEGIREMTEYRKKLLGGAKTEIKYPWNYSAQENFCGRRCAA